MPAVPSLALGTGEVSLLNLTSAYTAFANGGVLQSPVFDPPHRRCRRPRALSRRRGGPPRAERIHRVPDGVDAGGRRESRHRLSARARPVSACRPAARPAAPTIMRTRGSSASRRNSPPACGSASIDPQQIMRRGFASVVAVPAWAGFMKDATIGDKAEWITAPGRRHADPPLPRLGRPRHRVLRAPW